MSEEKQNNSSTNIPLLSKGKTEQKYGFLNCCYKYFALSFQNFKLDHIDDGASTVMIFCKQSTIQVSANQLSTDE